MYEIERSEDTKCFQQKYIFPGEEKWEQIKEQISSFIKTTQYMYNGGWAIHHFLTSLDNGLKIYNEDDICDSTDFDMFGPSPVEDLIKLGEVLRKQFPDMTFNINNGMHPNQYTILINFLGTKLVDWIYISPRVYKHIPSITYKNGVTCIHPRIELLRQYNMLSNIYLMAPDKDFNKAMKRIELLEKYAMIPWLKENDLWDLRKLKSLISLKITKSFNTDTVKDYENIVKIQNDIVSEWNKNQKYVSKLGHTVFNEVYKFNHQNTYSLLEFVVHDAVFSKALGSMIQFLKLKCKDYDISFDTIDISQHETFIGVIGPLYNGWVDFKVKDVLLCRLYSLGTPVHMYDIENRLCSYFFNMAHMMWRSLYSSYMDNKSEKEIYDVMVAYSFKKYLTHPDEKLYILNMKKESTLGIIPSRNFYMVNNLLRKQGIGFFRFMIDGVNEKKNKSKLKKEDFFYKNYDGKITFRTTLAKIKNNRLPDLNYLYERIKSKVKDTNNKDNNN